MKRSSAKVEGISGCLWGGDRGRQREKGGKEKKKKTKKKKNNFSNFRGGQGLFIPIGGTGTKAEGDTPPTGQKTTFTVWKKDAKAPRTNKETSEKKDEGKKSIASGGK